MSIAMSMITRKGTIARKTRLSRAAHPSVRRPPVAGSLRGGRFGIIASAAAAGVRTPSAAYSSSGISLHHQTATPSSSSTVPSSLLMGAISNPQHLLHQHQQQQQYGRQSIGSICSQHHPNSINPDQPQTSSSRPSLFNTLVQLKAYEEQDMGCGGRPDCSLAAAAAAATGDAGTGYCSLAPRGSSAFVHLQQQQNRRNTGARGTTGRGGGGVNGGGGGDEGGCCELIDKTTDKATNTSVVTVMLGMFMTVPVGMASIGVKHLDDCPVQPKIPVYLLVGGCFGLLKLLSVLWQQVKFRRYKTIDETDDDDDDDAEDAAGGVIVSKSSQFSEILLCLFLLVWFLCGNYWVLGVWKPNFDQVLTDPNNWCDKTVYLFAFIQILVTYALIVIVAIATLIVPLCRRSESQKT